LALFNRKERSKVNTLAIIGRLQKLLTKANIDRLDRVLSLLTMADSRMYAAFWAEFGGGPVEKGETYNTLCELRKIVRQYGGLR
jgi:hypothetical protein